MSSSSPPPSSGGSVGGSAGGGVPQALCFDGKVENYPLWFKMMVSHLIANNMHSVLDSEDVPTAEKAKALHHRLRHKVYAFIMQTIPAGMRQLMARFEGGDAFNLWVAIRAHFNRNTAANQNHSMMKLCGMKLGAQESIAAYAARMQTVASALAAMGAPVGEPMLLHLLTKGLPPSYSAFVDGLVSQQLTLDPTILRLLDHEETLKMKKSAGEIEEANYAGGVQQYAASSSQQRDAPPASSSNPGGYAQGGGGGGGGGGGKSERSYSHYRPNISRGGYQGSGAGYQGRHYRGGFQRGGASSNSRGAGDQLCYACDKPGHVSFDCPKNEAAPKCMKCRRLGHVEKQCQVQNRRGGWSSSSTGDSAKHEVANMAMVAVSAENPRGRPAAAASSEGDHAWSSVEVNPAMKFGEDRAEAALSCDWVLDSACSVHMTNNPALSLDRTRLEDPIHVKGFNGNIVLIHEVGHGRLVLPSGVVVKLGRVAYHPSLASNLLSVLMLTEAGLDVSFTKSSGAIISKESGGASRVLLRVPRVGKMFVIRQKETARSEVKHGYAAAAVSAKVVAKVASSVMEPRQLLHFRFGHISNDALKVLIDSGAVNGIKLAKVPDAVRNEAGGDIAESVCGGCAMGKSQRAPFSHAGHDALHSRAAANVNDRVHADLAGPVTLPDLTNGQQVLQPTLGGAKYLSTIIDEKSRKIFATLLKTKGEAAAHVMQQLKLMSITRGGDGGVRRPVKVFHSDGGGEYKVALLQNFFVSEGIEHTTTHPHTPQDNPIAERVNRTLFEMARSTLHHANLPAQFWGEAIMTAVYIRNRCLTTATKVHDRREVEVEVVGGSGVAQSRRTPEEVYTGLKPDVGHLRVFGSDAWVHVPEPEVDGKVGVKAHRCVMLGYSLEKRGYRVLNLETGRIVQSRDVQFNENVFTFRGDMLMKAIGAEGAYDAAAVKDVVAAMNFEESLQLAKALSSSMEEEVERKKKEEERKRSEAEAQKQKATKAAARRPQTTRPAEKTAGQVSTVEGVSASKSPVPTDRAAVVAFHRRYPTRRNPTTAAKIDRSRDEESNQAAELEAKEADADDPHRYADALAMMADAALVEVPTVAPSLDPATFRAAMSSRDAAQWLAAAQVEMRAHATNHTWTLVLPPPPPWNVLGNKWVFTKKFNVDGEVDRFKARIVAKGFGQQHGLDFHETFAPVLKYKTLRIIFALAAARNYELKQMDVTTAFLNATMKEDVFMQQPEGFVVVGSEHLVCKLNKTLYGTKQASHEWHKEVNSFIVTVMGYVPCVSEPCLYWRISSSGQLMLLGLFVDDLLSAFPTVDSLEWLHVKSKLTAKYAMKDLDDAQLVVGMRITRDRSRRYLRVDQEHHVEKLLEQFGMQQCAPMDTPEQSGVRLTDEDSVDLTRSVSMLTRRRDDDRRAVYQSSVGCLLYVALSTRPDIAHAVNQLSRFLQSPGEAHWVAAKRVMRYLRGTTDVGLEYRCAVQTEKAPAEATAQAEDPSAVELAAYVDADWGGCVDTKRSTSGYAVYVGGCLVSWASVRQRTVALSSAEAEYMALAAVVQEVKWLRMMLREVGAGGAAESSASRAKSSSSSLSLSSTVIRSDSQSAIALATSSSLHARTKHIDIRHHFIREYLKSDEAHLEWVPTAKQRADIFTKGLDRRTFEELRHKLMGGEEEQQEREGSNKRKRGDEHSDEEQQAAASSSSSSSSSSSIVESSRQ